MSTAYDQDALQSQLRRIVTNYAARSDTSAVQFELVSPSRAWRWAWSAPGSPTPYFIASTTKLYVSALIMQVRAEGLLDLDEPVASYLGPSVMAGIHRFKGVDYSEQITIRQLLAHTSGIADYFEQRRTDGTTTFGRALQQDYGWTFDDVLRITKEELSARFAPSTTGKAFYSDTNYQLLGSIIEKVSGRTFEEVVTQRIIERLGLQDTYPFSNATIDRYDTVAPMLYGTHQVRIPHVMASVRADGGMVSTARDGIVFLEAFMTGRLFPIDDLQEMVAQWRPIFPPLVYGIGILRFALSRYFSPFRVVPPMIGHSGASGAVLFFIPELDLYVSGSVNQIKKRSLSYNVMTGLVMACQDAWR